MKKKLIYIPGLIFTAFILLLTAPQCRKKSELPYYTVGGDITLKNTDGTPFSLKQIEGKPALLFFGYTNCPDACPTILSRLKKILPAVGEDAGKIEILFVSVDPERDTPEKLKSFLSYFEMNIRGLTGSREEIKKTAELYGVYYNKANINSGAGYTVDHTTTLFVLDQQGKVRYLFRYADEERSLIPVLKLILDSAAK